MISDQFFIKKVVQATRGCGYACSFCTVPAIHPGFRKRPVEEVIRDCAYDGFPHWWQNKIVWFWDDNLTFDRLYAKKLFTELKPLHKWWLTQASMDIAKDFELLDLMRDSGCIGVFLGIESLDKASVSEAGKRQNKVAEYKKAIQALHKRGIAVMAGFIAGFDHDTIEGILAMADKLEAFGVDVPFLSILTPFKGTRLHEELEEQGRLLKNRGADFYNGFNVTFSPRQMSVSGLLSAHRELWKKCFSPTHSLKRIIKTLFSLKPGACLLTLFMNSFYCLKKITGNFPIDMSKNPLWNKEIVQGKIHCIIK